MEQARDIARQAFSRRYIWEVYDDGRICYFPKDNERFYAKHEGYYYDVLRHLLHELVPMSSTMYTVLKHSAHPIPEVMVPFINGAEFDNAWQNSDRARISLERNITTIRFVDKPIRLGINSTLNRMAYGFFNLDMVKSPLLSTEIGALLQRCDAEFSIDAPIEIKLSHKIFLSGHKLAVELWSIGLAAAYKFPLAVTINNVARLMFRIIDSTVSVNSNLIACFVALEHSDIEKARYFLEEFIANLPTWKYDASHVLDYLRSFRYISSGLASPIQPEVLFEYLKGIISIEMTD